MSRLLPCAGYRIRHTIFMDSYDKYITLLYSGQA
jgi:hypothetical protein